MHHNQLRGIKLRYFLLMILFTYNIDVFSQKITYTFIKPSHVIDKVDTIKRYWIIDKNEEYICGIDTLYKFTFSTDSSYFSGFIKLKDSEIMFLNSIDSLNRKKIQRINLKFNKKYKLDNFCGVGPLLKYIVINTKKHTVIKLYRDDNLLISHMPFIEKIIFSDKHEYPTELIFIEGGKEYTAYPKLW